MQRGLGILQEGRRMKCRFFYRFWGVGGCYKRLQIFEKSQKSYILKNLKFSNFLLKTSQFFRERSPGDMMLSNFYHSSALQQAMFQQCLSKTLQLNPSIMMLYQNVFPTGNSLPAAPTVPGNPAEISIK